MITAEIQQDGETVCTITAHKTEVTINKGRVYKYIYKDTEEILDHILTQDTSNPEQVIQKVVESVYG
jgi:chorismate mutase